MMSKVLIGVSLTDHTPVNSCFGSVYKGQSMNNFLYSHVHDLFPLQIMIPSPDDFTITTSPMAADEFLHVGMCSKYIFKNKKLACLVESSWRAG